MRPTENIVFFDEFQVSENDWPRAAAPGGPPEGRGNLRTLYVLAFFRRISGLRKRLAPRSGPRRAPGGTGQPSNPTRARSPKTTGPAQRPPEGRGNLRTLHALGTGQPSNPTRAASFERSGKPSAATIRKITR
ncbi:hypothetical protein ScalyP_jg4483 [Parmales sp. scaly parma]|nr:hypothetical protein ScalyP_jg4483 [Parmales sp. scaly parma]